MAAGQMTGTCWKGQLRIAPIRCEGVYDGQGKPLQENGRLASAIQAVGDDKGLPLAILSTPKPSQARFYAARDKNGTPLRAQTNDKTRKDDDDARRMAYFEGRDWADQKAEPTSGLRGRKVYPHHRAACAPSVFRDYWDRAKAWDAMETALGNSKPGGFDAIPLIKAFLIAARGFGDALPLHYPRGDAQADPAGENYQWFVNNARGQRLSLPNGRRPASPSREEEEVTREYRTTAADAVLARFPPARRAKIKARAAEIVAEEMALSDLRKSKEMTQEEVARRLGGRQVYVSRLERRADMKLSTLRDYVEAIGGRLQLMVTFPKGKAVRLKDIGDRTDRGAGARLKGPRRNNATRA